MILGLKNPVGDFGNLNLLLTQIFVSTIINISALYSFGNKLLLGNHCFSSACLKYFTWFSARHMNKAQNFVVGRV